MSKTYEVSGIPHIVIIDPQGIVRWQGFPFLAGYELTDEVIDEILENIVNKRLLLSVALSISFFSFI